MSKNLSGICKHCGREIKELSGGYWIHEASLVYCDNVGRTWAAGAGKMLNLKRFASPKTKEDFVKNFIEGLEK